MFLRNVGTQPKFYTEQQPRRLPSFLVEEVSLNKARTIQISETFLQMLRNIVEFGTEIGNLLCAKHYWHKVLCVQLETDARSLGKTV
jgi:hypothetical protein